MSRELSVNHRRYESAFDRDAYGLWCEDVIAWLKRHFGALRAISYLTHRRCHVSVPVRMQVTELLSTPSRRKALRESTPVFFDASNTLLSKKPRSICSSGLTTQLFRTFQARQTSGT